MRVFARTLVIGGLMAAGIVGAAHATPISGTFGLTIYQGPGFNDINNPNNQANQANPLITPADRLGTGTYTGAINFNLASGLDTIGNFLATGGGSLSGSISSSAVTNATLSTGNFGISTVFVFTGNTNGLTLGGTISHDDGASLYSGVSFSHVVVSSAAPTVDIPTTFSGLNGAWELIYVEANGLPADLVMNISSTVPEPGTAAVLGASLLGWGMLRRRRGAAAA